MAMTQYIYFLLDTPRGVLGMVFALFVLCVLDTCLTRLNVLSDMSMLLKNHLKPSFGLKPNCSILDEEMLLGLGEDTNNLRHKILVMGPDILFTETNHQVWELYCLMKHFFF